METEENGDDKDCKSLQALPHRQGLSLFDISDEDDLILVEKTQSVSEPSSSN